MGDSFVLIPVAKHFASSSPIIDETDGISMEFANWRFSLRSSSTEPLLRLNIEARADRYIVKQRVSEIKKMIKQTI